MWYVLVNDSSMTFLTLYRPVGAIIAGWVTYGSSFVEGNDSWRIPVWSQLVTSGIVASLVYFLPESVREWY
jgi:hypothetical protein